MPSHHLGNPAQAEGRPSQPRLATKPMPPRRRGSAWAISSQLGQPQNKPEQSPFRDPIIGLVSHAPFDSATCQAPGAGPAAEYEWAPAV